MILSCTRASTHSSCWDGSEGGVWTARVSLSFSRTEEVVMEGMVRRGREEAEPSARGTGAEGARGGTGATGI